MSRAELVDQLISERYLNNQWWTRETREPLAENEITCRRRLSECVAEAEHHERKAS